ncbi:c-type cytochrome biogenesis protein CcmI [Alsobacter soli]|uniref:C-type cytochrome biogenesis protein CcmI n=1 Tax=Alsobacter soli TaxID=2109933 RepID=A0A2T1HSK5_9HYPH|nr:c-type cytochrome biogenesis protein CcmI [Alsobacter soli]PSC04509.1 c-type cytochrome biogenesis protein CcmI [Alsobacter soli]
MTLWIVLALMTGAAVLAVLWPLGRAQSQQPSAETATDAAFYKAQLAEIERDAERGLIEPSEAETAKVEAARRLLASARRGEAAGPLSATAGRRRAAAVVALVGLPLVSLTIYLTLGNPAIPDMPLQARNDRAAPDMSMGQALARIEEHLAKNPNDGRGQEVVGPVYMSMGRFADAERAFAAAIRILGDSPHRWESLGEAQVAQADGIVTANARTSFDKALALDAKLVKARYYRALAAEQDGDKAKALSLYSELAAEAPAGAPIKARLDDKVAELGGKPPQPSGEAAQAIAGMAAGDRMTAIRGMVASLDARLAEKGDDVEGWLRLVRSYMVLGEPEKARDAFARGRAALASDQTGRDRLEALGRELKIEGS